MGVYGHYYSAGEGFGAILEGQSSYLTRGGVGQERPAGSYTQTVSIIKNVNRNCLKVQWTSHKTHSRLHCLAYNLKELAYTAKLTFFFLYVGFVRRKARRDIFAYCNVRRFFLRLSRVSPHSRVSFDLSRGPRAYVLNQDKNLYGLTRSQELAE